MEILSTVDFIITQNPEISNFVILDDVDFGFLSKFPDNFINTGRESRFTDKHLTDALKIFTNKK